jgi:hypothetical protein
LLKPIPLNIATPVIAFTVVVPVSAPPAGPLTIDIDTAERSDVIRFPPTSSTHAAIAGVICVPAVIVVGI